MGTDHGAAVTLAAAGLVATQGPHGLLFRPFDDVALLMEEFEGRLTVVFRDGSVAHRPGPLQPSPVPGLVPLMDGVLCAPRHARRAPGRLRFPGGWTFPAARLPRPAKKTEAPPETIVRAGKTRIDIRRLRAIESNPDGHRFDLILDDGSRLQVHRNSAPALAEQLGLAALSHLEPMSDRHRAMYRLGLRDFPWIILEAPTAELKRVFGDDEKRCDANMIWEAARHRARGAPLDYGTEYRGFYYRPVLAVLARLGWLGPGGYTEATARIEDLAEAWAVTTNVVMDALDGQTIDLLGADNDPHYRLYGNVLAEMVGHDRLLTFADLGFADLRPDLRTLGTVRPEWLVVAEKVSIEIEARQLGAAFGVSTVVLGGMARWEAVEPVADMLRPVLQGRKVNVVTYGDYDPTGWEIDDVFVRMLDRYDIHAEISGRLILPERFSARELELVTEPIPTGGSNEAKTRAWMQRTHGVHGKPLRIHADHLRPVERVIQAFIEETGLAPLAASMSGPPN